MKTRNLLMLVISCALSMAFSSNVSAQEKGTVTVEIEGLRNNKGNLMIALTKSAMATDRVVFAAEMAPSDSTGMKFQFKDIPAGAAYVQIFHDENSNFMPDIDQTNGKVIEGIGRLPDTDDPKKPVDIIVKEGENTDVKIKMIYF